MTSVLQDSKGPKSPPKGKIKEEVSWSTGWWDFYPIVEQLSPRRVEWSNSSIIFSPHAKAPRVLARHFSSSKEFNIPMPTPLFNAPTAYEPPTVISVSPDDEWLFAYFPGKNADGSACLWRRGAEIDNWIVKEYWGTAPGAGIVAISWLDPPREWTTDPNGSFHRLPTRGPQTPVSNPTLLLVTQNHRVTLCYLRNYIPTLKMFSVSLSQPDSTNEGQAPSDVEPDTINVLRVCSSAAIGLAYDESSILVATRSHVLPYPPPNTTNDHFNAMDMSMPLDFEQQHSEFTRSDEPCGEESFINLTQVTLKFGGIAMNLSTVPLEPLPAATTGLSNLTFVSHPSVEKGVKGSIYLICSFLDFGDYTAQPQSIITCHSFSREEENGALAWKYHQKSSRSFEDEVVGFLAPTKSRPGGIYTGLYSTAGSFLLRSQKEKEVQIGSTKLLRIPELTDDDKCEPSPILTSTTKAGREVPIAAAVSPNEALICTLSSKLFISQVSVHVPPKSTNLESGFPPLSTGLATALLARRTTADIIHVLSLPSTSLDEVANVLFHTLTIVETQPKGRHTVLTYQTLGIALEVYRNRSKRTTDQSEKETLSARWQSAHDLCSLAACNAAFEDCRDADGPDLNAVWQFAGVATWIINFIEKVMKEIMLRSTGKASTAGSDVDLFGADPEPSPVNEQASVDSPYLLHIVHPYALKSLKSALSNVRTFRNRLGSLNVHGQNAQIAKEVVVDLVNCASVDLDALEPILDEFLEQSKNITDEDARKSLAACEPTISMHTYLVDNIRRLCDSGVMSKSRLYIKPTELIDGFESLSLEMSGQGQDKDKDVVSKGVLMKRPHYVQCLRCDGRSEVALLNTNGALTNSLRWRAWERQWIPACICGGSWVKGIST